MQRVCLKGLAFVFVAEMHSKRRLHATAATSDAIFAFGGRTGEDDLATCEFYKLQSNL